MRNFFKFDEYQELDIMFSEQKKKIHLIYRTNGEKGSLFKAGMEQPKYLLMS